MNPNLKLLWQLDALFRKCEARGACERPGLDRYEPTSCLLTRLQALIDKALCAKTRTSDVPDASLHSLSFDRSFAIKKRTKALSELANCEIKHLRAHLQAKASRKKQHSTSQSARPNSRPKASRSVPWPWLGRPFFDKQADQQRGERRTKPPGQRVPPRAYLHKCIARF